MHISITPNGINWIFALATSIAFAFLGLLVPNLYKQVKTPRTHNRHKFINEFLARHQLTYTTFFAAVVLTAEFKSGADSVKKLFGVALAFALGSYLIAVYLTVNQDDAFSEHGCTEFGQCRVPMNARSMFNLCKFSLLTSVLLVIIAGALVCTIK